MSSRVLTGRKLRLARTLGVEDADQVVSGISAGTGSARCLDVMPAMQIDCRCTLDGAY
jgi:hypothetical protein